MKSSASAFVCFVLVALVAECIAVNGAVNRVTLLPRLQPGQAYTYLVRYRIDKHVKTESPMAAPMAPQGAQIDMQGTVHMEVLHVQIQDGRPVVTAQVKLDTPTPQPNSAAKTPAAPAGQTGGTSSNGNVDFTVHSDGLVWGAKGVEDLTPEQQQLWQAWIAKFAAAWTFPVTGIKLGEKWKSEEEEKAPSLISELWWIRESTYVRDEACGAVNISTQGDETPGAMEMCAVVLTSATLKQKSSTKDTTPEDFRLHDLRTMGTARGTNEVILYISLKTGLVIRATEDAKQEMDVAVLKKDNSNRVHYNVDAASRTEILLTLGTSPKN